MTDDYTGPERRSTRAKWKGQPITPLPSRDLPSNRRKRTTDDVSESNIIWPLNTKQERRVADRRAGNDNTGDTTEEREIEGDDGA